MTDTASRKAAPPCPKDAIESLIRTTHCIEREFDMRLSALRLPVQLSGSRLRLLRIVAEAGPIRMSELAVRLGIKARTVTDLVDALERDLLIDRQADPSDRRATLLMLTETAQAHMQKVQDAMTDVTDRLIGHLSPGQLSELLTLLDLLVDKSVCEPCRLEQE